MGASGGAYGFEFIVDEKVWFAFDRLNFHSTNTIGPKSQRIRFTAAMLNFAIAPATVLNREWGSAHTAGALGG